MWNGFRSFALPLAFTLVFSLGASSHAKAQNLAPAFSHGPTIPFVLVERDSTNDWTANMLAAGAGYSLNWNLASNLDGTIRWVTLGFPQFVQLPDAGEFRYATGLTIGTYNNLVSFGALVSLVDTYSDTGAFLADLRRSDIRFVFSFGFNMGGGSPAPSATLRANTLQGPGAAALPVESSPPPCYIKLGG